MLYKYRGFILFVTVITIGGIAARLIWDITTDRQEPPVWATLLAAAVIAPLAMAAEAWSDRRQLRRARRGTAR
jgi:hypothetical protein